MNQSRLNLALEALPPMAESLGALSTEKFDGEIIENEKRRC